MAPVTKKFIMAFVIALLIFAITATVISAALMIGRGDSYTPPDDGVGEVIWGESFNVLLILTDYDPDKHGDYDPESVKMIFGESVSSSYVPEGLAGYRKIHAEGAALLRFDKERGELTYTHIPGNSLVSAKGVKMRLSDLLEEGVDFFVSKVNALTGIDIDTYFVFNPKSAAAAIDLVGELGYTIPRDMVKKTDEVDINIKAGSQMLDGKKTVDMLRYVCLENKNIDIVCGYMKRFVNKLTEDFTYEQISDIISSMLRIKNVNSNCETNENRLELLSEAAKLRITEISVIGSNQTVGGEKYFSLDEEKTLEKFKPYRKTNAPVDIWSK